MARSMKSKLIGSQWYRYCWLTGTILQKNLLRLEDKEIPSPERLRIENPSISISESIELAGESTTPRLIDRWAVLVRFGTKWFNVAEELEKVILASKEDSRWIENIGVDTRALNIPKLTMSLSKLGNDIANGRYPSTTEPPQDMEELESSQSR